MTIPNPTPLDGEKPLVVRRGRVESVDLYEIKDTELDHFENGSPGDLQLNFAIFLISTAFAAICSLATATFPNQLLQNTFLFVAVIGVILGLYLGIAWWRSRAPTKALCKKIRERIKPDSSTPLAAAPDGSGQHIDGTPPVG